MLKINVGLNKKASKDYQSTGLSINLEAELDSSLLARPAELQAQIDGLYAQAQDALERQAAGAPTVQAARSAASAVRPAQTAPAPRAGHTAPRQTPAPAPAQRWPRASATAGRVGGGSAPPAATESQFKAIHSIAKSMGLDAEAEAESLGFNPATLSRGDASRLIDHLKAMQSPQRTAA